MSASGTEIASVYETLKLLSDGEFHSGEELGQVLGVSRAAVWKHLQKMDALGIDLISIKGKGYCIVGGLDLLTQSRLVERCSNNLTIHLFPQIDSTNAYLLRQPHPERQVCLAESQTAGRGRRGRTWVSPFAQNLYLSIGWDFEGGVAALEGLSLAIGVGVLRSLRRYGVVDLSLKWPNDVLYQDKKLGGILIEMSGDPAGYCVVVIGVGLNIAMTHDSGLSIDQPWIRLSDVFAEQHLPPISRNDLAVSLINELTMILSGYASCGFAAYQEEWNSVAAYKNQMVNIHNGKIYEQGIVCGVDHTGALRLKIDGQEKTFHGGEVSLRRSHDS